MHPNLETLDPSYCKNLFDIDASVGLLQKLKTWSLSYCTKLKILPSHLRLKSLNSFDLTGCRRLENFPGIHPEMKCLEVLHLGGSSIRELPSSIRYLTKLETLQLRNYQKLRDLPDSIYKLQQLRVLFTTTAKLRPMCNSLDSFSRYGFHRMKSLNLTKCVNLVELDFLMKPECLSGLEILELSGTKIITIPESISRFFKIKASFNLRLQATS